MDVIKQEYDPEVPVGDIEQHPNNPRRGDDASVRDSMEHNDFFGAILVQRSTGYVIAGNTRYRVMVSDGAETIPAFWVDCDDETAKRIMLADNRTSDLAFYDDEQLFGLLRDLNQSEGLDGTGYDRAAYELLLQSIESDHIVGGIRQGVEPDERIDAYNELDVRSIILPYASDEYEEVAMSMAALRETLGFPSNADLVKHLVAQEMRSLADMGEEVGADAG
jgi:hypothetical protein